MEKLWTTAEAAQCLGLEEADVEGLVKEGRLTGYKLGGRFLRFRPDQVEALKGQLRLRPGPATPADRRDGSWFHSLQDFLYFHDFYVISAACLAILAIYLIAST